MAGGPLVKTVGLGPRFNSNSCSSCHAYPAVGGSSPPSNPLFGIYQLMGATNTMPYFITTNGPVIVARFPFKADGVTPDGGVHQMFTISNRTDAPGCTTMVQPNFTNAQQTNNIIFRQTTPTFGSGLIELIQESDILNNMNANGALKASLGISGHPNYSDDDGTIARFGWKAQNKSLLYFSGEAYTVEEGVSDEAFPSENDESIASCLPPFPVPPGTNKTKGVPDDRNDTGEAPKLPVNFSGDLERFSLFMRFLAPPVPVAPTTSTTQRPGAVQQRRLQHVPHQFVHHAEFFHRRVEQSAGESLFRPACSRHGPASRGQRFSGQCDGRSVPQRASVGHRSAVFLPA